MKILVTGHLGYIGSVLTEQLTQAGHEVSGMDWISSNQPGHPIPTLDGDIRDIAPDSLQDFEAVIHLAALPADSEDQRFPATSLEVNHLAAARLAVLAKVAGVSRFIFASASPELRGGTSGYQGSASAAGAPVPFDVAKGRAEVDLASLNSDEFRVVTLRIPSAYGFSPRMRMDLVVNALVDEARTSGELGLSDNSNDVHRPIHVHDVARGFHQALELPSQELTRAVYDLGSAVPPVERKELVRLVADRVDGTRVHVIPSIPSTRTLEPTREHESPQLPGFEAQIPLAEGISQLVADYGVRLDLPCN